MIPAPTPETDAVAWTIDGTTVEVVSSDFSRHMERDRDWWMMKAKVHSDLENRIFGEYKQLVEALCCIPNDLGVKGDTHATVLAKIRTLRQAAKQGGGA